jgi:hypothetical protein
MAYTNMPSVQQIGGKVDFVNRFLLDVRNVIWETGDYQTGRYHTYSSSLRSPRSKSYGLPRELRAR